MQSAVCQPTHTRRIFVLVPFFEALPELFACIRSLEHQTADFRAVLVDDGSSEATHGAVAQRVAKDPRFVLLRRDRREGPAAARAAGLDYIAGQSESAKNIVVLVDGDDRLLRDTALEVICACYDEVPELKMTLGTSLTEHGERKHLKPYRSWQLQLNLVRHVINWRGDHPRSFLVSHYKTCRQSIQLSSPAGKWLRAATDVALLLPMIERCRPGELGHLRLPLYEYRTRRSDQRTTHKDQFGRSEQLLNEHLIRRSLIFTMWKSLRFPQRSISLIRHLIEKFSVDIS